MIFSRLQPENKKSGHTIHNQSLFTRPQAIAEDVSQPSQVFFPSFSPLGKSQSSSENLKSDRFAGNPQLEAAYDNNPVLRKGHKGDGVALVQQTMIEDGFAMPVSTAKTGKPDGIFGSETFATTWKFQNKYGLDRDGRVGHDTLDKMEATMENKDEEPEVASGICDGIKAFGKDFANAITVVISKIPPSAGPSGNNPDEILFKTGGIGSKPIFEINANASLSPFNLGDSFEHGVIQTAKPMKFSGAYSGGKNAFRESVKSRDAEPNTRQPWVRNPPFHGGPVPFLPGNKVSKGFVLTDLPQHFFPAKHPKDKTSEIDKISFKTVFDFWHVAKKTDADGTKASNLVFMSNFQMTLESNAIRSKVNSKFIGNAPNYRLTKSISCGKGSGSPVLDTPLTINDLKKLNI